ncbi:hypothetical protein [Kitasatospora sp. NPDC094016]|uniref:hypothetical protein n=1 Tax=Kitasatospora sp. NPDC094016 TaxID=3154986 RepID=UPI003319039D
MSYTAPVYVWNNMADGKKIDSITVGYEHLFDGSGEDRRTRTVENLPHGLDGKVYLYDVKYRTGPLSEDECDWTITFFAGGKSYTGRERFRCKLSPDDAGKDVLIGLSAEGFHIGLGSSGGCDGPVE